MIVFGLIVFIIGIIAKVALLKTVGLVVAAVGVALWALGAAGHAVGGRRHYW